MYETLAVGANLANQYLCQAIAILELLFLLQQLCCKPVTLCLLSHAHEGQAFKVPAQPSELSTAFSRPLAQQQEPATTRWSICQESAAADGTCTMQQHSAWSYAETQQRCLQGFL